MSINCPVDGKDDSVQSVPALVLGGRSSGSFSGPSGGVTSIDGKYGYTSGSTHLYGTMTSDLAQKLAPPLPPKEISFWSLIGWSWVFLFSICIIIGPFLVWPAFKNSIAKNADDQEKVFTPDVSFYCILFLILGWHPITWLFYSPVKNMLIKRLDYPRRQKLWQAAYAKWEKLYYCHRCGILFSPDTTDHYPPNQLHDYLRTYDYEL
jgi:hypothetical protein